MFWFKRKKASPTAEIIIFAIIALLFLIGLFIWNNKEYFSNSLISVTQGSGEAAEILAMPKIVSTGKPITIKVATHESMYCGVNCQKSLVIYEGQHELKRCSSAAICELDVLSDLATVRSFHAEIHTDDGGLHLVDYESMLETGTWLDEDIVLTPVKAAAEVGDSVLLSAIGCEECGQSLQIKEGDSVLRTCNDPLNCTVLIDSVFTETRRFYAVQGDLKSNLSEITWSEALVANITASSKYPKPGETVIIIATTNELTPCGTGCFRELAIYRGVTKLSSCRELTCSAVDSSEIEANQTYHAQLDTFEGSFYNGPALSGDNINVVWAE